MGSIRKTPKVSSRLCNVCYLFFIVVIISDFLFVQGLIGESWRKLFKLWGELETAKSNFSSGAAKRKQSKKKHRGTERRIIATANMAPMRAPTEGYVRTTTGVAGETLDRPVQVQARTEDSAADCDDQAVISANPSAGDTHIDLVKITSDVAGGKFVHPKNQARQLISNLLQQAVNPRVRTFATCLQIC